MADGAHPESEPELEPVRSGAVSVRTAPARLLPPDVDLTSGWRSAGGSAVWRAVVWGRLGRGDLAVDQLDAVTDPSLQAWIGAERGRILRELGLHAAAEERELAALELAEDPVDAAMLRVSLAADAVGHGDAGVAAERLATAQAAVAALHDGPRAARQRLRLGWVTTEVALLTGAPVPSAGMPSWDDVAGEPVLGADLRWGSTFHRVKALLFAGVVRSDVRLLDAAAREAPAVLAWAVHLARADLGVPGALAAARAAWAHVVPPPEVAAEVAATPTARRLTEPRPTRVSGRSTVRAAGSC